MANDMTPITTTDRFELTTFLAGRTRATGIFEDRFGRLRRRLEVAMTGTWQDGRFHLDERFSYDDGRVETRAWTLTPGRDGAFTATCPDCIGIARGQAMPGVARTLYRFRLALPSRTIAVDLDDRLYRLGPRQALNRATVSKWGVRIGELTLLFERLDD